MTSPAEIRFTTSRNGQRRAFRFNRNMQRFFPMPLADAELAIATGAGEDITAQHAEAIAKYGVYL